MPELMNTREVARYLGINEKKVYFLAKSGKIPCTRVTGKWTFPKKLIDQWIEESASGLVARKVSAEERVFLLAAGSDDPSLGILHDLYEAQTRPATFFMTTVGSTGGLAAIRSGVADFATAHLLEPARANSNETALGLFPADAVIVELFYRELGLLVPSGNPKGIKSIRDLARPKLRIINRQPGSGTRIYLDQELACARLSGKKIPGYDTVVSTHLEAGLKVLGGDADVCLATRTTAKLLGLDFISLTRERFDAVIPQERFFSRGIQLLLGTLGSREFRQQVEALGGYDASESGRIITSK
ncbi:MAG TPA: substrate-binding domain-containing protein [Candidatus Binatia bacterium]|jgi:putative molybdopterin biosynthesis protein|nr:substrate-binding domain-containing protein [Candidatus Binatia bacterium]